MPQTPSVDNAQVRIPPPLCFAAFLLLGIGLQSNWIAGVFGPPLYLGIGGIIFTAGAYVILIEAIRHRKSGSNVEPWKPTTVILSTGFYKYSRNPIYVGMVIAYVGVTIAAMSWAAFLLLPLPILIVRVHVIAREEAYLESKFGTQYLDYKKQVRRWI